MAFLSLLRDLCLFRCGPQDVPYAPRLLIGLLIASAAVEAAFDLGSGADVGAILAATLGTLATLGLLFLFLHWRGKAERFVQTALGMALTGFVFELIALPLALAVGKPPADPAALTATQIVAALVLFALLLWQAGIVANILRHALDIPLAGAVLMLLALGVADLLVSGYAALLFGAA